MSKAWRLVVFAEDQLEATLIMFQHRRRTIQPRPEPGAPPRQAECACPRNFPPASRAPSPGSGNPARSCSRTQGGRKKRNTCARPLPRHRRRLLPRPTASCGAACVLLWPTCYLFCEAAAKKTGADEKPKVSSMPPSLFSSRQATEGVKTENNDHINLKVAGQNGSVVQFKIKRHTPLRELIMKAYCKQQVSNCWKWRMKIQLMCSSNRQEVSTKKGTCNNSTPELCSYRPRIHSQLENCNLVPPHPDYYSLQKKIMVNQNGSQ
ncbi:uncharacterized protein LOC101788353 isoform X2 [Cavia porcellus]|uniref:uncharacterized protein LOC101788353 isoform X2 n=1 Tax=Cavia porcellus TaxID=10141 RepID=UPI002FE04285